MKEIIGLLWTGLALTFLSHAVWYWFRGTAFKGQTFVKQDSTLLKAIASGVLALAMFAARQWWLS